MAEDGLSVGSFVGQPPWCVDQSKHDCPSRDSAMDHMMLIPAACLGGGFVSNWMNSFFQRATGSCHGYRLLFPRICGVVVAVAS